MIDIDSLMKGEDYPELKDSDTTYFLLSLPAINLDDKCIKDIYNSTAYENEKFRSDYAAINLHDRDIIRKTRKKSYGGRNGNWNRVSIVEK